MVNIVRKDLIARSGNSNVIDGTYHDDTISISGNIITHGQGSNNLINLYDGADNLWIGGKMWAANGRMWSPGRNTILGDNGQKNIVVKQGMDATKGGVNEIILSDKIVHYTTRHNLTIGSVKADHKGENIIFISGSGDDHIAFTGTFSARYDGQNIIDLGHGSKTLSFARGIDSSYGGKNILEMGYAGNHDITFGGGVYAGHQGYNQIIARGGNSSIHIKNNLDAAGNNDIYLGEGKNNLVIGGYVLSHHKGKNHIVSEGESTFIFENAVKSYGVNQIETGVGNDKLIFKKGLYAYGGINQIVTGAGNDKLIINGHISAGGKSSNIANLGKGNDVIDLNAYVARKDLVIDAGEGYDTLILRADNSYKFAAQYKGWFSDMYNTSLLTGSGIEEVKVDIVRGVNLSQIDWLTQMVNSHNAGFGDDIAISLALDTGGARINLDDIFTARDESSISVIDLTGSHRNELRIHNTLASNGYDGAELRIDGDSNDRVGIDGMWAPSGGIFHENENYYQVWDNAYGESLLIQDGVEIYVY